MTDIIVKRDDDGYSIVDHEFIMVGRNGEYIILENDEEDFRRDVIDMFTELGCKVENEAIDSTRTANNKLKEMLRALGFVFLSFKDRRPDVIYEDKYFELTEEQIFAIEQWKENVTNKDQDSKLSHSDKLVIQDLQNRFQKALHAQGAIAVSLNKLVSTVNKLEKKVNKLG